MEEYQNQIKVWPLDVLIMGDVTLPSGDSLTYMLMQGDQERIAEDRGDGVVTLKIGDSIRFWKIDSKIDEMKYQTKLKTITDQCFLVEDRCIRYIDWVLIFWNKEASSVLRTLSAFGISNRRILVVVPYDGTEQQVIMDELREKNGITQNSVIFLEKSEISLETMIRYLMEVSKRCEI